MYHQYKAISGNQQFYHDLHQTKLKSIYCYHMNQFSNNVDVQYDVVYWLQGYQIQQIHLHCTLCKLDHICQLCHKQCIQWYNHRHLWGLCKGMSLSKYHLLKLRIRRSFKYEQNQRFCRRGGVALARNDKFYFNTNFYINNL